MILQAVVTIEVVGRNEAGEVGRCLEADMGLEVDEICEELVDLCDPIATIKGRYGEGGSGEGSNGSLGLDDNVEGGGHVVVEVVVAAGKASDWCRTGF